MDRRASISARINTRSASGEAPINFSSMKKCGTQHSIQELADAYDSAEPSPILKPGVHDAHSAAGLLKLYLRELPEPVIPFHFYDRLKATGYRIDDGQDLQPIISILETLPAPNYTLLQFLCQFLFEVSEHCSENRMTVENLASVFAPNILRQAEEDPDIEMAASPILSVTVAGFIKSHRQLFLRDLISLAQFESATALAVKASAATATETATPDHPGSRGFVESLKARRRARNRSKTMTLSRAQYGTIDGESTHSTPERYRKTVSDRGQIWFPHERHESPTSNGRSGDGSNASSSLAVSPSKDKLQAASGRSTARGNGIHPTLVLPSNTAPSFRPVATSSASSSAAPSPAGLHRFSSGEVTVPATAPSRGSTGRLSEASAHRAGSSDLHRSLPHRRTGEHTGSALTALSNSSSDRGLSSCDSRNALAGPPSADGDQPDSESDLLEQVRYWRSVALIARAESASERAKVQSLSTELSRLRCDLKMTEMEVTLLRRKLSQLELQQHQPQRRPQTSGSLRGTLEREFRSAPLTGSSECPLIVPSRTERPPSYPLVDR
ncbi:Rho GTPase activating protein 24 [Sparganum proliferum]